MVLVGWLARQRAGSDVVSCMGLVSFMDEAAIMSRGSGFWEWRAEFIRLGRCQNSCLASCRSISESEEGGGTVFFGRGASGTCIIEIAYTESPGLFSEARAARESKPKSRSA